MDVHILSMQARVLLWVGLGWIAFGLWQGYDPATVAWRAALGALVAMWATGKLLHLVTGVINERMATDIAIRDMPITPEIRPGVPAAAGARAPAGAGPRPSPVAPRPVAVASGAAAPGRPGTPEARPR